MKRRLLAAAIATNFAAFVAAWCGLLSSHYPTDVKYWFLGMILLAMPINRRLLCAYVVNREADVFSGHSRSPDSN